MWLKLRRRLDLKKWIKNWWKKEIAVFVAIGTILGVISACGIVPEGFGWIFLFLCLVLSVVISIAWTFICLFCSSHNSTLNISDREGSKRSLTSKYKDKTHKYTYIFRQDLLDYSSTSGKYGRSFISMRILKGKNVSSVVSDGVTYFECTEYKTHCKDIKIKAIDLKTKRPLRVEFLDRNEKDKYYEFPFKIFFATPLKKKERFEIAYLIELPNELEVLKEDDEIMSISLSRYAKGVDELEFNVCLNFFPTAVHAEHKKKSDFVYDSNNVTVELYKPTTEIEKMFDIKWSSDPYIIRWHCNRPKHELYAINYRK